MGARTQILRTAAILVSAVALLTLTAPAAWAAAPTITGFSPQSGPAGTTVVTITGTNFATASAVTFTPNRTVVPPNFTVNGSGTQITVTVPANAHTGPISVTNPDGTVTSADSFVVTATDDPTIASFTPSGGAVGISVAISGTNFDGATFVRFFNNVNASFVVNSSLQITATVPSGVTTGPITVVTPAGSDTSASDFTVFAGPPTVTGFAPNSGPIGTSVSVTGTNFSGATSVTFNNVAATTFNVVTDTQLTATVPSGATTGKIKVIGPGGVGTSPQNFTVTPAGAPTIASFSPPSGPVGTVIVITGTNLTGATSVRIGNKAAASFTVDSATQISATVANGTQSGPIQVTTPAGTATSATDFTVGAAGSPTISSFTPSSGAPGTLVTVNGSNFTGATDVVLNLTDASSFTVVTSTQITATVAGGTTTGFIKVTTPSGTATSATKFTVPGTPEITSFSPTSGAPGISVQINGSNLTGATSVRFGNGSATFTVDNTNRITAIVPSNAGTGPISVTTPNGTNQSLSDFTVETPEITSFDPPKGPWGTTVVITGVALSGATAVRFGGTSVASFTIDSATQISARVANGTVTGKISITLPSGTLTSVDDFVVQHLRSISLSLGGNLTASGRVVCLDGTAACASGVPVKVQRRIDGTWKTVGTGITDGAGNYGIPVPAKAGKYRAVAPKTSLPTGDRCPRTRSGVVVN